jgi:molybdopterin/thiamine biosynthesis adenylyltransferase/rhodanese-related sulfurtransferase
MPQPATAPTPWPEIAPAEARLRQAAGAVLIDVREPAEWTQGTPCDALRVPLAAVVARIPELVPDRTTPLLTICASGGRSRVAAERLHAAGYGDVLGVAGGFNRWKAERLPFETLSSLDDDARERYSRHVLLPEIGEAGQHRLAQSTVLILGAGGLGSPSAFYLAAAGVGTLRIVDFDRVDRSNLQRQILHRDEDVGELKVESATRALTALNPRVRVDSIARRASPDNIDALIAGVDVVVDGSDNLPTRYLVNDACVRAGKPLVYGAVHRFEGQASVFWPGRPQSPGPCYRCLFPEPPPPDAAPNCAEAGVMGVVPGLIGLMQANEAIKLLLGIGEPLVGRLVTVDALGLRFREVRLPRDPDCPGCGPRAKRSGPYDVVEAFCAAP